MGHLGTDRTTELIKPRFCWPLMDDAIKHFVTQVCPCVKRKKPHIVKAAAMQSISLSETLEITIMDFLNLDKSSGRYKYLLVVTGLFKNVHASLCCKEQGRENCSRKGLWWLYWKVWCTWENIAWSYNI